MLLCCGSSGAPSTERDSKYPKYIEIACAVFFHRDTDTDTARERERERERERVLDGKILMIDRDC